MGGTRSDRSGLGTSMSGYAGGERDSLRLRDAEIAGGGRIAKRVLGETTLASGSRVRVTAPLQAEGADAAADARRFALDAMDRYSEIMAELAD